MLNDSIFLNEKQVWFCKPHCVWQRTPSNSYNFIFFNKNLSKRTYSCRIYRLQPRIQGNLREIRHFGLETSWSLVISDPCQLNMPQLIIRTLIIIGESLKAERCILFCLKFYKKLYVISMMNLNFYNSG